MRRIILPILILFAAFSIGQAGSLREAPSITEADSKIVSAVRAVLEAQSDAWNRGDIEGFLDGYARSPDIVFVSGDKVMRGWQTVLDYYKQSYNSPEKMGKLTFSELEITPLGSDAAIVLGRWHLKRVEDEPRGRFTLLLRRTEQGWKVVHDHTSSA